MREWIAARVGSMLGAGWLDEVRRLMASVPDDAPAWNASGYDVLRRHLRGELSLASAVERVVVETRQFAKRQRTWFRHQLVDADVTRVDPTAADAEAAVRAWWTRTASEGAGA